MRDKAKGRIAGLRAKTWLLVLATVATSWAGSYSAWAEEKVKLETLEEARAAAEGKIGFGLRLRYLFMPAEMLEVLLAHATPLDSTGLGAEIAFRRTKVDIVVGVEYDKYAVRPGYYLSKGADPTRDTEYVTFPDLGLLAADVAFWWHLHLHERLRFRYGAGLGMGMTFGEIVHETAPCDAGTTVEQLDDAEKAPCKRSGTTENTNVPPVFPVVQLALGLQLKLAPRLTLNLEAGLRNALFMGMSTNYYF